MADEIRKIVAILSCDVVFEEASGTEAPIESFHEVQRELVAKHGGEWHPEAGNQALATFDAPLDAVLCAVDVQRAMGAEPGVIVRSGVHIGDLVFRKYDESTAVFGDAVNVAVRLNAVIHGSGVCVSEKVFEAVRRTRGLDFKSLGEKHLKNVNRPIRVHQVGAKSLAAKKQKSAASPAVGPAVGTEGATAGSADADAATVGAGGANRRLIPIAMGVAIAIAAVAALMLSDWGTSEDPATSVREEVDPAGEELEALDPGSGEEIAAEVIEVEEVTEAAEALEGVDPAAAGSVVDTGDTSAEAELASFGAARRALLALDGAGRFDAALWTVPDPVKNEALYQVGFEAKCACSAVVFAVNGSADEITLLYPNPYEPPQRLVEGSPARIPSTDAWQIRAVGGEGIDVLKLVVTREALTFPGDPTEAWAATPADSAQVAELIGWLESVQAGDWDAATAPLQIIP